MGMNDYEAIFPWLADNSTVTLLLSRNITSEGEPIYNTTTTTFLPSLVWFAIVMTFGGIGNATVLTVFLSIWKTMKWTEMFVFILSFGDLLESIVGPCMWLSNFIGWRMDPETIFGCKALFFTNTASLYSSALILIMVSIDRYIAVRRPFMDRENIAKWMIIITCLVAIFGSSVYLIHPDFVSLYKFPHFEYHICFQNPALHREYTAVLCVELVMQVIAPFLAMTVFYSLVIYEVRKQANRITRHMSKVEIERRHASVRRTSKLLTLTIIAFLISITPIRLFNILTVFNANIIPQAYLMVLLKVLGYFSMANQIINPLFYGSMHNSFRKQFNHILKRVRRVLCGNSTVR